MSKHTKPAPKHRGAPKHAHLKETPLRAARTTVVLSSVALAVTGITIGGGLIGSSPDVTGAAADLDDAVGKRSADKPVDAGDGAAADAAPEAEERAPLLSRNDHRGAADPAKEAGLVEEDPAVMVESESLSESDPRDIARALMPDFGFSADQFGCLDSLWTRESNWNVYADNPTSSAYGIPQALPGEKMSTAGADWATNPVTQITWGLGYIRDRYGSPCSAWGHSESVGWY